MRRFINRLVDLLYPRAPGEPDRSSFWDKLLVLGLLGSLIALGILAR